MKISKWVDFSQEVDIDIDLNDVRAAIGDAFSRVTQESWDEKPTRNDVIGAFSRIGTFLSAVTDEHIAQLLPGQKLLIGKFLAEQSDRFKIPEGR